MFVEVTQYETDKIILLNCMIIRSFTEKKDGDYFTFVHIILMNGDILNVKGTASQLLSKIDSVQHIYVK